MKFQIALLLPIIGLTGCQLHSSVPEQTITVAGHYQAVADCFYLAIRGEGMWKKDDLPSMNMVNVIMGTERFDAGKIEFTGVTPTETSVKFLIPHSRKFEPKVRACAGVSPQNTGEHQRQTPRSM